MQTSEQLGIPGIPQPEPSLALTPVELLRIAVSQNADLDKLEKLMALQERWEANEARKAFVEAMNAFKACPPQITKNKHVKFGTTEYDHATLDHVCDAVIAGLSRVGISHRWKIDQSAEWITVTCILTHEKGHYEETKLIGAPDQTGSKNSIQAIGSTVTYLQRYTLLAATGLAAANTDSDGSVKDVRNSMSQDRLAEHCEWIANACDLEELKKLYRNAYQEAAGIGDRSAMKDIIKAKDNKKKEME